MNSKYDCIDKSNSDAKDFSIGKSLSVATLIMMGSVLLSRVFGIVREMVLARYGGTSFEMDAYVTAFILPELLNHFLAGGFLSITFIPIFQRHLIDNRQDKAWESFSNLICIGTIFFIILVPALFFFTPEILTLLGPHIKKPANFLLTVKLTRIILPAQLFFYWGAFLSAVQMTHKHFFFPALAPVGYNGGIIIGGLVLGPRLGIEGFAWGVLVGAIFGNFLLQLPGAIKCGMRFGFRCNPFDPDVALYIRKTLPLILGLGMTFSNEIFFRFFGSFLSEGATSSVNYAFRTTMMMVAVFGQASGAAFYPFLTQLAAEKRFTEMVQLLDAVVRKIALYIIPLSTALIITARPVISILFERGRFNTQSTIETASVFSIYAAGCFAFSVSMIIARSFYALQNTILPMAVSTSTALISIPMYYLLSTIFGARGIAVSAVTGITMQFAVLYFIWSRRFGSLERLFGEVFFFIKIILISLLSALPAVIIRQYMVPLCNFKNPLIHNGCAVILITIPMLLIVFLLYDRLGIRKFGESTLGLIGRWK